MQPTALDQYLRGVRKGMRGVARSHKDAFCQEMSAHFESCAGAGMQDSVAVGRAMRQVHGISFPLRLLFWIPALPLGILSMPFFEAWFPDFPATFFLLIVTIWVLLSAYYGGRIAGLITGILAAAPRLLGLLLFGFALDLVNELFDSYQVSAGTYFGVICTTLMLPLIGLLAGGRIKRS